MKPQTIKHFLIFIIIFVFTLYFSGCAFFGPTKPNLPYAGKQYPSILNELARKNPLLVQELGKLPELQNGISETEAYALRDIVELYNVDQANFEKAFNEMYKIGLPEVRKYCSPLQALYWLAESGELAGNKDLIEAYSLEKLLDGAWKFDAFSEYSEFQLTQILNGIKNEKVRNNYLAISKRIPTETLIKYVNEDYRENKFAFTKEARKIIEDISDPRWKNFDIVTERLNSPQLIDYYERRRFSYVDWRLLPQHSGSLKYVFKHNVGQCVSVTNFTIYCLLKAGYRAKEIRVPGHSGAPFHALTLFEMNGKKYIMDNGTLPPRGINPYVKR